MADELPEFNQSDISDANGPIDTVVGTDSKTRLCTDPKFSPGAPSGVPVFNSNLIYEDMNASTGGVAREAVVTNATWVKTYEYSGSGILSNFIMNLEDYNKWLVRLVVDSSEVFGAAGISTVDMESNNCYAMKYDNHDTFGPLFAGMALGLGKDDTFFWGGPKDVCMYFNSSVKIYVKRASGENNKMWRAGLIVLQKDT